MQQRGSVEGFSRKGVEAEEEEEEEEKEEEDEDEGAKG